MHPSRLPLALILTLASSTYGLRIPFKQGKRSTSSQSTGFRKTFSTPQVLAADADNNLDLSTVHDLIYLANVTIAGTKYPVQLDTGSSDLWVQSVPASPNVKPTSVSYNLTYGIGWAYGHVTYAPVTFAGISVDSQAFLNISSAENPALSYGADGILGLGFTSLSTIDALVNSTKASTGRSLLFNLFNDNPSEPNFIAFALQRSTQANDDVEGSFSVGEYEPDYKAVADSEPIPTFPVNSPKRWDVLLDAVLIGDKVITPTTAVPNAPSNKAVALLDSGTSYSYVPTEIAQAIYGGIAGATYDASLGQWIVPCDAEIDMALQLGGQVFPLHPLDISPASLTDDKTCVGSFIPQSISIGGGEFDWLVGDNFLRSVYSVYDFGDFDSSGKMGNPFVKLLSLVDPDEASTEFVAARGGTARSGITYNASNATAAASKSTTISPELADTLNSVGKFFPVMLAVTALNALALACIAIALVIYTIKKNKRQNAPSRTPRGRLTPMPMNNNAHSGSGEPHVYQPIVITEEEMPMEVRTPTDPHGPPSLSQRSSRHGTPSPINIDASHAYNPVSMALTEDTLFAPPSPAYHKFGDRGDRPKSVA